MEVQTPFSPADLVARIVAGDSLAEEELVSRYSRGIAIILRRQTNDSPLVDDLYQETFRLGLEKIRQGQIREPEKLSGFLASLAKNLTIEHFRRSSRHDEIEDPDQAPEFASPAPSPYEQLLQKEQSKLVRQVIEEMPGDRDRQVLFRFYIAEEDKERICADLNLSSLHFNRVLFRARERYRELYEKAIGQTMT